MASAWLIELAYYLAVKSAPSSAVAYASTYKRAFPGGISLLRGPRCPSAPSLQQKRASQCRWSSQHARPTDQFRAWRRAAFPARQSASRSSHRVASLFLLPTQLRCVFYRLVPLSGQDQYTLLISYLQSLQVFLSLLGFYSSSMCCSNLLCTVIFTSA